MQDNFVITLMALLTFSPRGIYCEKADVYIDPWLPVSRALITHGHSDHARWGHAHYLSTHAALPVIRHRLGDIQIQGAAYGQVINHRGVEFSFHPAGHVPGSAQIRVACKGEAWVVSGDYKTEADGLSEAYEAVPCQHFVTESTFGLPIYRWQPQAVVMDEINRWWANNRSLGINSVLIAYALGKAQRILANIDSSIGPVYTHAAVENVNEVLRQQGLLLPVSLRIPPALRSRDIAGGLILAPPSVLNTPWLEKLRPFSLGIASGWMALRGARRRRAADRGFVLSDHADWQGLNEAVAASGASQVYTTHGYADTFAQWLNHRGIESRVVSTRFQGENLDNPEPIPVADTDTQAT